MKYLPTLVCILYIEVFPVIFYPSPSAENNISSPLKQIAMYVCELLWLSLLSEKPNSFTFASFIFFTLLWNHSTCFTFPLTTSTKHLVLLVKKSKISPGLLSQHLCNHPFHIWKYLKAKMQSWMKSKSNEKQNSFPLSSSNNSMFITYLLVSVKSNSDFSLNLFCSAFIFIFSTTISSFLSNKKACSSIEHSWMPWWNQ